MNDLPARNRKPLIALFVAMAISMLRLILFLDAEAITYVGVTTTLFLIPAFKEMDRPAMMSDTHASSEPNATVAGGRN